MSLKNRLLMSGLSLALAGAPAVAVANGPGPQCPDNEMSATAGAGVVMSPDYVSQIRTLRQKVDRLASDGLNSEEVRKLRTDLDRLTLRVGEGSLPEGASSVTGALNSLQGGYDSLGLDMGNLKDSLDSMAVALDGLETRLEGYETLKAQVNSTGNTLLTAAVRSDVERLDSLKAAIEKELSGAYGALETAVGNLTTRNTRAQEILADTNLTRQEKMTRALAVLEEDPVEELKAGLANYKAAESKFDVAYAGTVSRLERNLGRSGVLTLTARGGWALADNDAHSRGYAGARIFYDGVRTSSDTQIIRPFVGAGGIFGAGDRDVADLSENTQKDLGRGNTAYSEMRGSLVEATHPRAYAELGLSSPAANLGKGFGVEAGIVGGAEFGSHETDVDRARRVRVNNGEWSDTVTDQTHDAHPYHALTAGVEARLCAFRGVACVEVGGKYSSDGSNKPAVRPEAGLTINF